MFSDYKGIKLEIKVIKIFGNSTNIWKLNIKHNNSWTKGDVTENIRQKAKTKQIQKNPSVT